MEREKERKRAREKHLIARVAIISNPAHRTNHTLSILLFKALTTQVFKLCFSLI